MKKLEKRVPGRFEAAPHSRKHPAARKGIFQRSLALLLLVVMTLSLFLGQISLPARAANEDTQEIAEPAVQAETPSEAAPAAQAENDAPVTTGETPTPENGLGTPEEIMAAPVPVNPDNLNRDGYTVLSEESLAMLELTASLFSAAGDQLPHDTLPIPEPNCGHEQHVHTLDCYKLTCTKPVHTHGINVDANGDTYICESELTCKEEEHVHGENVDENGNSYTCIYGLVCTQQVHTHSDENHCPKELINPNDAEHTHDKTNCDRHMFCTLHQHTISCFYEWQGEGPAPSGDEILSNPEMGQSYYTGPLPDGHNATKRTWDGDTTPQEWVYKADLGGHSSDRNTFHVHKTWEDDVLNENGRGTCWECTKTAHTHTADCYKWTCTIKEHTHDESCNGWSCGKEAHTHTDECYKWSCGLEAHVHAFPACYDPTPSCGIEEHLHSAGCYEDGLTPADYAWANKAIEAINKLASWDLDEAKRLADAYRNKALTSEEEASLKKLKQTLSDANALYNSLSPKRKVLVTNASYLSLDPNTGYGFLLDSKYGTINFTVQYYCNQFQYNWGGGNDLTFIVPEGAGTPKNGGTLHTQTLGLVDGRLAKTWQELPFYADREFLYDSDLEDSLARVDRLSIENSTGETGSGDYVIKKIQVIDVSGEKDVVLREYSGNADTLRLTDGETRLEGGIQYIHVDDGMTLRICYDNAETKTVTNPAHFFDYDITDGNFVQQKYVNEWNNWAALKNQDQGINSPENYENLGSPADQNHLTFGGETRGVTHAKDTYQGTLLNSTASTDVNEKQFSCTFDIVDDTLDVKGNLKYNVDSPYLFLNEDPTQPTKGKTHLPGNLDFEQEGNTYTLSSATVTGDKSYTINKLRDFNATAGGYSNRFWPMDGVYEYQQVWYSTEKFDENGCAQRYYSKEEAEADGVSADQWMWWAPGHDPKDRPEDGYEPGVFNWQTQSEKSKNDDPVYHNPFFGMEFQVDFSVPSDYLGEMKYIFYGDDDMFVFLTNTKTGESRKIADLGGVHSSVGYMVDLWDYIDPATWGPEEDLRNYRLSVFFTERGAYGSSCYIQYRLPDATPVPVDVPSDYDLEVDKTVTRWPAEEDEKERFQFKVTFVPAYAPTCTDQAGNPISIVYDEEGVGVFTLAAGEKVKFSNIPVGVTYTIEEAGKLVGDQLIPSNSADYHFNVSYTKGNETVKQPGASVSGTPSADESVHFYNDASTGLELPLTGGVGTTAYTAAGLTLVVCAVALLPAARRKKRI